MNEPLLPLPLQVASSIVLLLLLGWVLRLIRSQRLSLRESLLWLLSTSAALVVTIFPSVLRWVASSLDIAVPANALFAFAFVYVLVNLLASTIAISGNTARLRRLTQECTLLRAEIESLRARVESTPERPRS